MLDPGLSIEMRIAQRTREATMNYSPSYRARKLGELAARLREIRYNLATVLGGRCSEHAELRHLDELVLMIDERRGAAKAAEPRRAQTPAPPPGAPHKIR